MSRDRRDRDSGAPAGGVEFEFGTTGVVLVSVVVLALCAISFWLGRQSVPLAPPSAQGSSASQEGAAVMDGGDVEKDLTFFDRLEAAPELSAQGDERTVLPPPEETKGTGVAPATPAETTPPAEEKTQAALPVAAGGAFQIQVLATTEKAAAEAMVVRLRSGGFPAQLTSGDFKGQLLFRVRVGGYADEKDARQVAQAIREREGLQTWVTR
jgi:cell division septation protein DedD